MFSIPSAVERVSDTLIFARMKGKGRQYLAYQMLYETREPVAMILPLPVLQSAGEKAVRFVNFRAYPQLLTGLSKLYPRAQPGKLGTGGGPTPNNVPLPVYAVGRYEASYIPTVADFERLDPRFRLPEIAFKAIPAYESYGFAVFQLTGSYGKATRPHPLGIEFATREPDKLFFPTVHLHEEKWQTQEHFDHELFAQWNEPVGKGAAAGWEMFGGEITAPYMVNFTQNFVRPDVPLFRRKMNGMLPNKDTFLTRRELG